MNRIYKVAACFLVALTFSLPLQAAQQTTVPASPLTPTSVVQNAGQVLQANAASLSASDTGPCNTANACVSLNLGPLDRTFNVTSSGTYSATAQIEGTTGNGTWVNVSCPTFALGASVSNFTANGGWVCSAAGLVAARVRVSTYASGTVVVGLSSGQAAPSGQASIPQALLATSEPTFAGINSTGLNQFNGVSSKVFNIADFTTANNTNLQAITGLSWSIPSVTGAVSFGFHCGGSYSQATGQAAVTFGLINSVAVTNGAASGIMETGATTVAFGTPLTALTTAASNVVVVGTPASQATVYAWFMDGHIENPAATANIFQIAVKTANGSDAATVYRDSYCHLIN